MLNILRFTVSNWKDQPKSFAIVKLYTPRICQDKTSHITASKCSSQPFASVNNAFDNQLLYTVLNATHAASSSYQTHLCWTFCSVHDELLITSSLIYPTTIRCRSLTASCRRPPCPIPRPKPRPSPRPAKDYSMSYALHFYNLILSYRSVAQLYSALGNLES
jgi:hypothetical protein